MPKASDSTPRVSQAQFDRLTGGTRDDWRKWTRRGLVVKPSGGYSWTQIVAALALLALEEAAGIEGVVHCWDDLRDDLATHIRQPVLDLVIDPGVSAVSRPRMRAFISTSDEHTAALVRDARHPHVLALAEVVTAAREEFERSTSRAREHADKGNSAKMGSRETTG